MTSDQREKQRAILRERFMRRQSERRREFNAAEADRVQGALRLLDEFLPAHVEGGENKE